MLGLVSISKFGIRVNPLIAYKKAAIAVDARIILDANSD
jgi:hypothetical protein